MKNSENTILTDATKLCLECGLCCIGIFHSRAAIHTDQDRKYAKEINAELIFDDNKEYFKLPCPAYDGKCSIYPHNPSVCQLHECDLLQKLKNKTIDLSESIAIVKEMKKTINVIGYDISSLAFKSDTNCISTIFNQFLSSTIKEERKNYREFIMHYMTFFHLKKKRFYK